MNHEKMNDAKLVRHLRRNPGDDQGWATILRRYNNLIWHNILHRTGEEDHELYRDVQYAIWDGLLNQYTGKGSVLSYISGIIADQVKSEQQTEPDEITDANANSEDPDQATLQSEAASRVSALLDRLKLKERKMLILQYFGHSHKDISRILGFRSVRISRRSFYISLNKVSDCCWHLGMNSKQLSYGITILRNMGELYEVLGC